MAGKREAAYVAALLLHAIMNVRKNGAVVTRPVPVETAVAKHE
jgi:hypothetical protein